MASNNTTSGRKGAGIDDDDDDDDDDRISNLPCEVLDHILQFLPLKDAVRICILSTDWRSKWTMLPKLFFFGEHVPLNADHARVCRLEISKENIARSRVVSRMLVRINNFTLRIPHWFSEDADAVINQWVQFVSGIFVKVFTIVQDQAISRDKSRELPMSMFNPIRFKNLTRLTIVNFGLPSIPTHFKGFPCLVRLDVRPRKGGEQSSGTAHALGILVSKCPQLESLDSYIYDGEGCLTIRAPKLRTLDLSGVLSGLCFQETKKIEGNLPTNGHLLKPPCELGQLKVLILAGLHLHSPFAISFMLTLFRVASNLQKLDLHLWDTLHCQRSLGDMIDDNDCCLEHLKAVKVSCLVDTSGDILLQLIKLILSSSPVLEVMTIGVLVGGKRLNLHQLLQCPQASANAKIIIKP